MSKSLAELRAEKPASRPERWLTVCLAPHLVGEVHALTTELLSLPVPSRSSDDDQPVAPSKMAKSDDELRADEIGARMEVLLAEMAEWEGELRLRAMTDGDWRRWANAHPARGEDEPGHSRDQEVTGGYCNADDLIDALGLFAHSWNGEPLAAGDWDQHIAPNMSPGDFKQAATAVVSMHESRLDFRQWRSGLSANLKRLNDSASPANSASPLEGSTGGSPEPSNADTTATETPAP